MIFQKLPLFFRSTQQNALLLHIWKLYSSKFTAQHINYNAKVWGYRNTKIPQINIYYVVKHCKYFLDFELHALNLQRQNVTDLKTHGNSKWYLYYTYLIHTCMTGRAWIYDLCGNFCCILEDYMPLAEHLQKKLKITHDITVSLKFTKLSIKTSLKQFLNHFSI